MEKTKMLERRMFECDIRAENDEKHGHVLRGRPIVFEQETDLGWYTEKISRNALDTTDLKDVRFLVGHRTDMIPLARSRNNNANSTMQFTVNTDGMDIRVDLDTENNAEAKALYSAAERGDITGMSYAFIVEKDSWEDIDSDHPKRTIESIKRVFEVSAVAFPAYTQTSLEAREKDAALESARISLESARAELRAKGQKAQPTTDNKKQEVLAMTTKEIDVMTIAQMEARMATIDATETDGLTAEQLTALNEERQYIEAKLDSARMAATLLAEKRAAAAKSNVSGHKAPEPEQRKKAYTTASPEYHMGFLKELRGEELTAEERDAITYVAKTTDETYGAGLLVSKQMADEIWDRVSETHSILGDITMYRTGTVLEIAVRSEITQGDAAAVNEAAANDDEVNTFIKVTITGQDFSKHVDISYAMAKMAIDAFEPFLVNEIADRLGAALATYTVTQITTDYYSAGNAVNSTSVKAVSYKDVAGVMALLENAKGQCVFYARRATIYNYLVGMVDTTGRPIFQPNAQAGQEGTLIGCPVKVEDGVAANKILVGFPANVVGNMVQDVMVESDRDIKTHVITHSGYCRFGAKLIQPKSFALLTVKQS